MKMIIIDRILNQGIQMCLETFVETNTEFTVQNIAEHLNKIKWGGKDTWYAEYIEMYLDNLRGNASAIVIQNLIISRFWTVTAPQTVTIVNSARIFNGIKSGWNILKGRLGR